MKKVGSYKNKKSENIISQSAAADIAGVTRQAINGLKDKYDFFVGNKRDKVDISSSAWQSYMYERGIKSSADGFQNGQNENEEIDAENVETDESISVVKKNKKQKRVEGASISDIDFVLNNVVPEEREALKNIMQKIPGLEKGMADAVRKIKKEQHGEYESSKQKHALTGGVNPSRFIPMNLADVERMAKIQNLNLQMRTRLGELIERDMVERVIDVISQTVQSHFVDMPRKVSGMICKKLDRVGAEKSVEKILSGPVAKGIGEIKKISLASVELKRLKEEHEELDE